MKKIIAIVFLLLCLNKVNSQNYNDEYLLLDELLSTASNQKKFVVIEESVDFAKQQSFFNKRFFTALH